MTQQILLKNILADETDTICKLLTLSDDVLM